MPGNPLDRVPVPCNGCTACCRAFDVVVEPQHGDIVASYDTVTKAGGIYLRRQDNGDCVYLTATGCSIYDRAPVSCRKFDCRNFLKVFGGQRAAVIKNRPGAEAVFAAAEERREPD